MKWLLTIFTLISALFSTVPPEDIPEQGISFVVEVSVNEEGNVQTEFEILVPENAEEMAIEEEDVNEDTEETQETEVTEATEVAETTEVTEATEVTEVAESTEVSKETILTETTEAIEIAEEEETTEVIETTESTEAAEAAEEEETTEVIETTESTEATEVAEEETTESTEAAKVAEEETTESTEATEAVEEETTEATESEEEEFIEITELTETETVELTESIKTSETTEVTEWNGEVLQCRKGYNYGPSGKETWYDLNMAGVIKIMRDLGYSEEEYPYWVREDGCKMFGPYIMVAGDIRNTRTRGDIVETSLGTAMVCDHCAWAEWYNPTQLDIATDWVQTYSQRG